MSNKIMKRLPKYYRTSVIMWGITRGIDAELTECENAVDNFDKELNISTAENNLSRWERDLGLATPPQGNDYEAWLNQRRGNIFAKLRGDGICFTSMAEAVAESYTSGRVQADKSLYPNFILKLDFLGNGVPARLTEIFNAIAEIKPAHMLTQYEISAKTELPPSHVYTGGKVVSIRRRGITIAAEPVERDNNISAMICAGGKVVRIHHTLPLIPAAKMNTFADIRKKYTFEEMKKKNYAELLYEED